MDLSDDADGSELDEDPRHDVWYTFAHVAFRTFALNEPFRCLRILRSERAGELLRVVYRDVVEVCCPDGAGEELGEPEFVVHHGRVGRYPAAVVELPEPQRAPEAFLVALVLLTDPDALEEEDHPEIDGRYFTLELGMTLEGSPRTVLCEWTRGGNHKNYGDGPPPVLRDFCLEIGKLLD